MSRQVTSDELAELYQLIGAAIWNIQYLEDVLHTFLALKIEVRTPGRVEEKEAYKQLAKHRRANLGTSLRVAERNAALAPELIKELWSLKEERDWLVHRSMQQDGVSLYDWNGRNQLLTRIEVVVDGALSLRDSLANEVREYCRAHNVPVDKAIEKAERQMAELRGET